MPDASNRHRCRCGRFVRNVRFRVNGLGDITLVTGECSRCGRVEIEDWDYESLVGHYGDLA